MYFKEQFDGPSIEEIIKWMKTKYPMIWKENMYILLRDETLIWHRSFDLMKIFKSSYEEYERVFLDRSSHVVKNDKKSTRGLFSYDNFLLHVRGCIQQENVIIFVKHNSKHNFIILNFTERLQVPKKHIQST